MFSSCDLSFSSSLWSQRGVSIPNNKHLLVLPFKHVVKFIHIRHLCTSSLLFCCLLRFVFTWRIILLVNKGQLELEASVKYSYITELWICSYRKFYIACEDSHLHMAWDVTSLRRVPKQKKENFFSSLIQVRGWKFSHYSLRRKKND